MSRAPARPLRPHRLLDASLVALNREFLMAAGPDTPINLNEYGVAASGSRVVWTGTDVGGSVTATTCDDWTSRTDLGTFGDRMSTDSNWTDAGTAGCDSIAHLYCFETR